MLTVARAVARSLRACSRSVETWVKFGRTSSTRPFSRSSSYAIVTFFGGAFQDFESPVHQSPQLGFVHGLPGFDFFQRPEQRAAYSAGAVRPIGIHRDAFEAGKQ